MLVFFGNIYSALIPFVCEIPFAVAFLADAHVVLNLATLRTHIECSGEDGLIRTPVRISVDSSRGIEHQYGHSKRHHDVFADGFAILKSVEGPREQEAEA